MAIEVVILLLAGDIVVVWDEDLGNFSQNVFEVRIPNFLDKIINKTKKVKVFKD